MQYLKLVFRRVTTLGLLTAAFLFSMVWVSQMPAWVLHLLASVGFGACCGVAIAIVEITLCNRPAGKGPKP